MAKLSKGDPLILLNHRGRPTWKCYYWGRDEEDPFGWVFVLFKETRHLARVSPRWLRRV